MLTHGDGTEIVPNPNQGLLDEIDYLAGVIDDMSAANAESDMYMQDYINSIQQSSQQQMAEMSNMFNAQLAQQDAAYQQAVQQQNLLAQQEEEAARAFMINQGRSLSPANLQIGATYGTPKLAGPRGFKYSPQRTTPTSAQVASAFTAPTLAASATPKPQLQPTVLNV